MPSPTPETKLPTLLDIVEHMRMPPEPSFLEDVVWKDGGTPVYIRRTTLPEVQWRKLPLPRYTLIQRCRIGLADWLRWLADKVTL